MSKYYILGWHVLWVLFMYVRLLLCSIYLFLLYKEKRFIQILALENKILNSMLQTLGRSSLHCETHVDPSRVADSELCISKGL